ncbi:MAG: hypothetical protein ACOX4W_05540 [Bacilli bacterium]
MYIYIEKDERQILTKVCEEIILNVQNEVKEYFSFDFRLIGSGEKRLLTKNGESGEFDLDYNIFLQKDKKNLLSSPDKIKQIFLNAFNNVNSEYGFKYAQDSTSVITSKLLYDNKLYFSFDVAIIKEGNNGNYYKLIFDKFSNRYIWNEVKQSKDYMLKFKVIKEKGYWLLFKKRYLELKNMHLRRNDQTRSFSIFLETINEFYK